MPNPPISPARFDDTYVPDPSTASPGKVKRARRVAARAKAILEEKGWTQGVSTNSQGNVCLSEAISEARRVRSKPGLAPLDGYKMSAVITGIMEEARPKVTRRASPFRTISDLVTWNDKNGRTKEQVLALLSKAAGE